MANWYATLSLRRSFLLVKAGKKVELTVDEIKAYYDNQVRRHYLTPLLKQISASRQIRQTLEKNGISRGRVSKWRNGINLPTDANLAKVEAILQMDLKALLGESFSPTHHKLARIDTIKYLRSVCVPRPAAARTALTLDSYRMLEKAYDQDWLGPKTPNRDNQMAEYAKSIGIDPAYLDDLFVDWFAFDDEVCSCLEVMDENDYRDDQGEHRDDD